MRNKLTFDGLGCGGCRTCEIACSFHHKKVFCPSISSIEIVDKPGEPGCRISLYVIDSNGHLACNSCECENEPLCLKYCSVSMREILKSVLSDELPKFSEEVKYAKT